MINKAPFYSPTALPVLLQGINRESRSVALKHYSLSFPSLHSSLPGRVWFNPELETVYFSRRCFKNDIYAFERASPPEMKNIITKLALDCEVWWSYQGEPHEDAVDEWENGWDFETINSQITITQYKNLEEVILVSRLPHEGGCVCCRESDEEPEAEEGAVELSFLPEDDPGSWESRTRADVMDMFARLKAKKGDAWNPPRVRNAVVLRDGVIV